jgi:hypothetical protein
VVPVQFCIFAEQLTGEKTKSKTNGVNNSWVGIGAAGVGIAVWEETKSRIRTRASGRVIKTEGREGKWT